jgi:hypothetical protein
MSDARHAVSLHSLLRVTPHRNLRPKPTDAPTLSAKRFRGQFSLTPEALGA